MRSLYTLLLMLLTPFALLRAARRYRGERWGFVQRLGGGIPKLQRVIWIHAASVGEVRAVSGLAQSLAREHRVLITTTTTTGRDQALALAADCEHAYLPYDFPWTWMRWFRQLQPRALLLVETELWPNLVAQARAHHVPTLLINARMSSKSESEYARFSALTGPMIQNLRVLAQTESSAAAFARLGATDIQVVGNLKYDLSPVTDSERVKAFDELGAGSWFVAASTHSGEEQWCIEAFLSARVNQPDLRLLLVPRHPQRFDEVASLIASYTPHFARLSSQPAGLAPIVLGDAMGRLRGWMSLASVVFIGGTLIRHGGQNPIEAAEAGCVVIAGPSRFNFPQVFNVLESGALIDADQGNLSHALIDALSVNGRVNRDLIQIHRGATQATLKIIESTLVDSSGVDS